ncbi:MAG: hypothetical protein V3W44_05835, partial [Dehalococcoidales bacterium]
MVDTDDDGVWDEDSLCVACSTGYSGYYCDDNRDGTWDGVCAMDNGAGWTCDNDTVFYDGTYYRQQRASDGSTDGEACENGAIGSDGFSQEGYGLDDGTCDTVGLTAEDCDSDAVAACAGTEPFYSTCDERTTYADSCDSTITSGVTWSQTGTCVNDGQAFPHDSEAYCDNTYEAVKVGATYYDDCNDAGAADGSQCDSSAASGGDFSPDGVCTDNNSGSASDCCTGVSSRTGSDYICGCSVDDYECDSDVNASGYAATGSCQGSSCCDYVTGPRQQGQSCDANGDCATYSSSDTCYYSGNCTSGCQCSFPTDTSCPVATSSCTYGGCGSSYCLNDTANTCYYGAASCGGSGWTDKSSESCPDPGTVSSGECYYDSGGSVDRSDDCALSGCSVGNESEPYSCTSGSWADGSMSCWTGTTCYYSNDGCAADTDGWDYSNGGTYCYVGNSSCCPTRGTIAEGVSCIASGPTGTSYDRDTSQSRCESTDTNCTAYYWDIGGEV